MLTAGMKGMCEYSSLPPEREMSSRRYGEKMNIEAARRNRKIRFLVPVLFSFTVVGWLIAGLWPFEFNPPNGASLDGSGLRFASRGMAYACSGKPIFPSAGFTAEFLLEPAGPRLDRAGDLISLFGNGGDIIDVYQWRDRVIVSSYHEHRYESGAKAVLPGKKRTLVTVSAGKGGIWIYANGKKMAGTNRPLSGIERSTCFTVGNSSDGRMPWKGTFLSLSLSGDEHPNGVGQSGIRADQGLIAYYPFKDTGLAVNNSVSNELAITVPEKFRAARMLWLEPLFEDYPVRLGAKDALINLVGFIPGGFLCFFLLSRGNASSRIGLSMAVGFCLSLGIETAQVFLPERYSQLSDLALNTAGAAFGAVIASFSARAASLFNRRSSSGF